MPLSDLTTTEVGGGVTAFALVAWVIRLGMTSFSKQALQQSEADSEKELNNKLKAEAKKWEEKYEAKATQCDGLILDIEALRDEHRRDMEDRRKEHLRDIEERRKEHEDTKALLAETRLQNKMLRFRLKQYGATEVELKAFTLEGDDE